MKMTNNTLRNIEFSKGDKWDENDKGNKKYTKPNRMKRIKIGND